MSRHALLVLGIGATVAITVASLATAGDDPARAAAAPTVESLGSKTVYVVSRPFEPSTRPNTILFEDLRVVRLGDRYFLSGKVADYGEGQREIMGTGKRIWTPLADVIQMTEFENTKEANRYFELRAREAKDRADQPQQP